MTDSKEMHRKRMMIEYEVIEYPDPIRCPFFSPYILLEDHSLTRANREEYEPEEQNGGYMTQSSAH